MPGARTDGGRASRSGLLPTIGGVDLEELRRRNSVAVGMDVLYIVTTAFFAYMLAETTWTAAMAALPTLAMLYFGWSSSRAFFAAQVLTIVAVVGAVVTGVAPL